MNKGQRKLRGAGPHAAVQTVPFSFYNTITLAAGATSLPIYPTSFPRVLEIADAFDCYRVTDLRYRLHPGIDNTATGIPTGSQAVAFYPGTTDNAPASVSDVSENPTRAVIAPRMTVPSPWSTVPRAILSGYQQWYKTIPGSPDPDAEYPGIVFVFGTAANRAHLELEGVFQFKGAANTGATPKERLLKLRLQEKERILQILSSSAGKDLKTAALPTSQP